MRDVAVMPEALPARPDSYELKVGHVHVWRVPLKSRNIDAGGMRAMLSEGERERAGRFAFEQERARFIACRATLRMLLGRYAGTAPERIIFRYERGGKPALTGSGGWQFNVSHSRELAAIAVSRHDAVGVDIERIDAGFPRDDVAADVLAPDELEDLRSLPEERQAAYFFQLWTMKEALLKAAGTGLSIDPVAIRIRLEDGAPTIVSAPAECAGASLHGLSLDEGYAGAVAVLCAGAHVTRYQWSP